jgi:type I restriction enzyme S subunit
MGNWKDYKIGDIILNIADGGTPSRHDLSNFGNEVNWVVISDIQDEIFDTKEKLSQKGFSRCSSVLWKPGSIILSTGATIGEVGITRVFTATKQGISGIEVKEELILSEYLKYWFQLNKSQIKQLAQGSTIKEIRPSTLVKIPITIPESKEEQSTIASILTTIDQAIEKTEQLIAKYERIKTGLMQDLLTRGIDEQGNIRSEETHEFKDSVLGRIPKEWEVVQISQIVKAEKQVTYGIVQPGIYDPFGALLIRGVDYISGWKSVESYFRVRTSLHEQYKRSKVTAGDVLICIVGATTGTVQVIPPYILDANITQTTARISCDENLANGLFIFYQLHSTIGSQQVRNYIKGSAQPGLNLKDVEKFLVKLPEKREQEKISNYLSEIDLGLEKEKDELLKLHKLKTGLMQDLLTGKVRVDALMSQAQETI